jgi:hypothetical protein
MIWVVAVLVLVSGFLFLANLGLVTKLDRTEKRAAELERLLRESMKVTDDGLSLLRRTVMTNIVHTSEMRH